MKISSIMLAALVITIAGTAFAQQNPGLPSSGSFKLHSGWKGIGENVQVSENHISGGGNYWGVTFNDAGSGPLHAGAVVCPYVVDLINGTRGLSKGLVPGAIATATKFLQLGRETLRPPARSAA